MAGNDSSFDHLVGAGEQRARDRKTKCLGGSQIDDQFEPGGLYDRKICRFGSIENPTQVDTSLERCVVAHGRVANQTAGGGELGPLVHDWHLVARRQRHELVGASSGTAGVTLEISRCLCGKQALVDGNLVVLPSAKPLSLRKSAIVL
jgi:hypothetical protein